ncbi:MAG: hypothetical protein IPP93_06430 [Chitinophagaceae bacterium]|nr:hypothetical protein [Chitinophagaceae bacterium]
MKLPFVIVQRRTVVCPAVTPVTVVVGEDASVIAPSPLVIVHTPVPDTAVLPARVNVLVAHWVWSVPALATVTATSLVRDTSSQLEHVPLYRPAEDSCLSGCYSRNGCCG